jgi:drug/metabolite transporter (DMT)-like permease
MSFLAKSEQTTANRRYFVEEQMVAAPSLIIMLAVAALVGQGETLLTIRQGFSDFWSAPYLVPLLVVGLLSQGTGVFGSLIFLDRRENSYCVPVNRSSSILAGVAASYLLLVFPGEASPRLSQLIAAFIILVGILFLTVPPQMARNKLRRRSPDAL